MFCKTIILSNSSNLSSNAPKGILTLSKQNNFVKGKIRLYNLASLPTSSKLGLYVNQQVYTAQILKKANYYEFDLNENVDITQNLYCAIIDNATVDKTVLLEGGNLSGFCFSDSPTDAILEAKDDELELEISSALNNCKQEECCDCSNCEYKKYFYANQPKSIDIAHLNNIPEKQENIYHNDSTLIDSVDEVKDNNAIEQFQENVIETLENQVKEQISLVEPITKFEQDNISHKPTNEQTEFLNDIVYQLDEMLKSYPAEDMLNTIIPDSKFVRVSGENSYVIGAIYEDNMLKYIAYGVPATYNSTPPADLGQHYQWLPTNPLDVMSDGYFMIYQNALNGTIVEINFE